MLRFLCKINNDGDHHACIGSPAFSPFDLSGELDV